MLSTNGGLTAPAPCHPGSASEPDRTGMSTVAGDLTQPVPPLRPSATCEEARNMFDRQPDLLAIAVVDDGMRPIGVINRFRFLERLASRFGRELSLKKSVTHLMDVAPLVLDGATHLDELGTRLLEHQSRYVFDGFIVTREGVYAGLGTGLDLVRALTERRHAELQRMALHDLLTGLPNRALFEERLAAALAAAAGRPVAVMFIDLDRFKEINDTYGHRVGDLVLCAIGQRLRGAVRRTDLVARLSGDEFAVVTPDLAHDDDAGTLARVLLDSCRAPLAIDGREVVVSCSIGVAIFPRHGTTQETLLRAADAAQYHAKEVRNSWHEFSPEMRSWRTPAAGLAALRKAIATDALDVHYQPVVDVRTGVVSRVEALVRWTDNGTAIPAGNVVHLAEESGLIVPLSEFVMRTALRQLQRWDQTTGRIDLRLSVNVSAVQVNEGGLIAMVDRLARECGFDLSRLDLELTERAAMRASASALSMLTAIRDRGITVTIDDFGTGYSALSRLERLPIDAMKIDKSFLEQVDHHRTGVIAKAIIAMGHALGLSIVGEGVETPEQFAFLAREGCDLVQGFLLCPPVRGDSLHGVLVNGIRVKSDADVVSA